MDAKELFSAAVRVVGLLSVGRGFNDLLFVFFYILNVKLGDTSVLAKTPGADFVYGTVFFVVGLYLLRGAPMIVNFAFPLKNARVEATEQEIIDEVKS